MAPTAAPDPTRVDRIATHYRRMVGFFALQILLQLGGMVLGRALAPTSPESVKLVTAITVAVVIPAGLAMLYQAIRLALVLGTLGAELCVVGLFAPMLGKFAVRTLRFPSDPSLTAIIAAVAPGLASVIGLLSLLRLSGIAARECKAAGIPVGLLGPRPRPKPAIAE
jgi:hypothetical protein